MKTTARGSRNSLPKASLVVALLALVGCSTIVGPFADGVPGNLPTNSDTFNLTEYSVRSLGTDDSGNDYLAALFTENGSQKACLIVVADSNEKARGCAVDLPVTVTIDGVTATLHKEKIERGGNGEQVVGNYLSVSPGNW